MDLHPGERIVFEGHPSWRSTLGFYIKALLFVAIAALIGLLVDGTGAAVVAGLVVFGIALVVGYLKRLATHYVITTERLHIRRGILSRRVQQTQIDRVQNVNTDQSLLERMLRVGTVDFDTAGTDDSDFTFSGVSDPPQVVRAVDEARRAGAAAPAAETPPTSPV